MIAATDLGLGGGCSTISIAALVELAQERVVLELGELVRLRDLGEVGRADRPDLLGLLEQLPDLLDDEDRLDVGLAHAGRGKTRDCLETLSRISTSRV